MQAVSKYKVPAVPIVVLGSSAYTALAYFGWLAWDQEKTRIPGTSDFEGPYQAWQVIGLAVSLAGLVVVLTWRRTVWGLLCVAAVVLTLTVVWIVDNAGPSEDANMWPIGAFMLVVGSTGGLIVTFGITQGIRHGNGCDRDGADAPVN